MGTCVHVLGDTNLHILSPSPVVLKHKTRREKLKGLI